MRTWLINCSITTTAILFFCFLFPSTADVAAYIINSAPIFGACFILTVLISRQAILYWWAEHMMLRGVGGKSRWQRDQQKKKEKH